MSKKFQGFLGILAGICFCVSVLTGITHFLACNASVMERIMREEAPPEETLLPETEYPGMNRMITGFLAGREKDFQYTFTENGSEYVCFQKHEQVHMTDCRELIRLDGLVFLLSTGTLSVCLLTGLTGKRKPDRTKNGFGKGFLNGSMVMAGLLIIGVTWAVLDFDRVFTLFHEIAFTNDLWLLNPNTDMLIRLMPETFFTEYGIIGGIAAGVILTAVILPTAICVTKNKRRAPSGTRSGDTV